MNNLIASTSGHPRARPAGPLEIPPVFLAIRSTPREAPQRRSGQVIHERALRASAAPRPRSRPDRAQPSQCPIAPTAAPFSAASQIVS